MSSKNCHLKVNASTCFYYGFLELKAQQYDVKNSYPAWALLYSRVRMHLLQRTLRRSVQLQGVGLHSGKNAVVTIMPAFPNSGIIFVRSDLEGAPEVTAHFKNVTATQLATTVGFGKVSVSTVEHLLSALSGLGIDNAIVDVTGPELPILDGSSLPYCEAIEQVGIESQLQVKPAIALTRSIEVRKGDKWAIAEPCANFEVHASVEWNHPLIGRQDFLYKHGKTSYADIAGARTFCHLKDVEAMKSMGLAKGGSLENAIVLDHDKVLNPEGLRFRDEFVRHKILDAIGDLKLAGIFIQGRFKFHKAGHELHYQLLNAIFKDSTNFELVGRPETVHQPLEIQTLLAQAARVAAGVY